VIDDDADAREALEAVLGANGARVSTARSAEEARDVLRASLPDAIVSDIRLPGDDGYTLLRDLRSRRYLRTIPAIAVTGVDPEEDAGRSTEAGFHLRLVKPVDPETLVAALAQVTARSHADTRSPHPGR
jgi:CheY-like chemotaxis protein